MAYKRGRYGIGKGWTREGKREECTDNRTEKEIINKLAASRTQMFRPGMAVWHRKGLAPRREEVPRSFWVAKVRSQNGGMAQNRVGP